MASASSLDRSQRLSAGSTSGDGKTFSRCRKSGPRCAGSLSVMRANRTSVAGTRYLDLQRQARQTGRPTDELIQLYALECFIDRLTQSVYARNFVLKGGVLLAALDARRPTRDIDLAASALRNSEAEILAVVRQIAGISLQDGIEFDPEHATAEVIREEDDYSGIRVTLGGTLSRATVHLHVDVNIGDP